MRTRSTLVLLAAVGALAACGGRGQDGVVPEASAAALPGRSLTVRDTVVQGALDASGIAEPAAQATLSTRLMGTVIAVLVKEGDLVRAGQPLVRIDARDLDARREQVRATIASAEAAEHEAALQATRMRKLVADSAAPRAQLDAVEAGLLRATAGVQAARAGEAELAAVSDYAVVRAPFAGTVIARLVDPGAFAAPGTPLLTVQDQRSLRVVVSLAPDAARSTRRGASLRARIEGVEAVARVEAIIPATASGLYTVNAIVDNRNARYAAGGAATLSVPQEARTAVFVPQQAIRREGDLTGVSVEQGTGTVVRWVRLGAVRGDLVEVLSGLRAGEVIRVPDAGGKE